MSAEAADGIRWVPVGEAGEVRMGKQLSPASRDAGGQLPYLRVANVFEGRIDYGDVKSMGFTDAEKRVYELRPGDILLNEGQESLANVGRSAVYDGGAASLCFQNTLIRFRPGSAVLSDYAQAVFVQWRRMGAFARVAEKTSISHLGGSRFAKMLFPVIPLEEQRRIVEILDAVAESERAAEAAISKLQASRRGILLGSMAAITASEAPDGWERLPLKEVVPSVDYGISVALDEDSRGVATLRMNNLRDGRPHLNELRYCPQKVHSKHLLRMGDVLFNRTNSIDHVGRSGIWRGELEEATFASYLVRLNPDVNRIIPQYLVEWLLHPAIRQRVRAIATVAVQQVNVNPTRLRELYIDLPTDLGEQKKLVASLEVCDRRIATERESLGKLQVMKRGLADALLDGKRLVR
ncbi:restriction endonuclease subunit S [Streptomyces paromomycinus]|uniref:Type-1 restriction enzyme EcoKI specificity protein n=1 Tax=Streptomyces paromomycinus TaxID=92743 RepID=A0A401W5X1_STREY|nr:restriction endonuclease subunit S [Streptomyces paromomycinus]GCD44655.1 type-1 restriction enzyme EcoKI specificity protein [Streptomyces paromomycinus]